MLTYEDYKARAIWVKATVLRLTAWALKKLWASKRTERTTESRRRLLILFNYRELATSQMNSKGFGRAKNEQRILAKPNEQRKFLGFGAMPH